MQHSFVVSADEEDLFIEVHLTPLPLWGRVKNAVRYVFGSRSIYGDFEEILLSPSDAIDLADRVLEWAQGSGPDFPTSDVY